MVPEFRVRVSIGIRLRESVGFRPVAKFIMGWMGAACDQLSRPSQWGSPIGPNGHL